MKQTATGMSRLKIRCTERQERSLQSGVEGGKTEAADTVEYRLCENPEDGQAVETEWKKMDQALPESSGTGQASEDMENEVFIKHFLHMKNCRIKEKYIQFRMM